MKILVLLKFYRGELNPFDGAALESALEWGGDITVLTMAPKSVMPQLEALTRLGVKACLITDQKYSGSDTQATSYILAEAIKRLNPDVIFAGRQSVDGDTAQVPPMLAERLGKRIISSVMEFNSGEILTRGGDKYTIEGGEIVTFERIRTLRFPSIFSRVGEVTVWDNSHLSLDESRCGLYGSPTRVIRSYESSVGRREVELRTPGEFDTLIKESLYKKREEKSDEGIEKTDKIYYFGNIEKIARRYAHEAIPLSLEGKTPSDIARELQALSCRVVLFEATDYYREVASRVAVLTGAGICADCISFRDSGTEFIMTRPALGGNVTADIISTAPMSFATVRGEDTRADELVFALGRGAIPYIDKIKALADVYGATLATTRVLTDSGVMPYSYQVGLTGKVISPRVYVTFGISGAVQHTSAISGAGVVISINSDKNARIFDYSDYGIVADIKELFEEN